VGRRPRLGGRLAGSLADPSLTAIGVTFVSSHALGGGSERYLELLLGKLEEDWIDGLVCLQDGPFVERMRNRGHDVTVVPTPPRAGMLSAAMRLRTLLLRRQPQLVHANGVKAALVCAIATAGTKIPVLWLKHDFSWDGPLARAVAALCREVVAVSSAIVETFTRRQRRKVHVVPNGIPDIRRDRGRGRRMVEGLVGAGPEAPVVALVGRLHPVKGHTELLEAAPLVLERVPDARFALMGGEDPTQQEYARRLRERAEVLGLSSAVRFLGHRDDVLDLVAGCDAMVMPSVPDERGFGREACPYALLEAMSLGTVVVAYADGGIPEVLEGCGLLVPPGDRAALADALGDMADRPQERQRLAALARERVRSRYRIEATAEAMKARYRAAAR
jgi:glycosyltransferase involved in cell wall biosynthesis